MPLKNDTKGSGNVKIGILTWYKELNHGAILQAYASQEFLKQNGYFPSLLDYNRVVINNLGIIETTRKRIKRLLVGDYRYCSMYENYKSQKGQVFREFIKRRIDNTSSIDDSYDCVMIGSDMVFSLVQGYSPYMFGNGINAKYIFSYAACSGGTKYNLAVRLGVEQQIKNGLSRFDVLGCRDEDTIRFIKTFLPSSNPILNIDPVLLYGFDKEKCDWNSGKYSTQKYLLVYSYHGDLNSNQEVLRIRKYAESHGLTIISIGYYHPWCDENINGDPERFFDLFLNAKCVITDTFHGTVFSIILNKNFCSIVRGNAFKLYHLLLSCGLISRIAKSPRDIDMILNTPIDYSKCYAWLSEQRVNSKNYILESIKNASQIQ